jgi:antitoxin (DNA-binding transcriptional repressor) of toxin-antitoxin stability system
MERISAEDVVKRLPELLRRAERGEHFAITQDGQDKAEIGPRTEAALPRALAAAEEIRELRQTVKPLGVPIRQAIEEGRA